MRLGIGMLAALALLGCANNDAPTPTGTGSTPHTDVTGSWTLTWGPMAGNFTVHDTTGRRHDTTFDTVTVTPLKVDTIVDSSFIIVNRLVGDTCNATGSLFVTQGFRIDTTFDTTSITPLVVDTIRDSTALRSPGDVVGKYTITRTCSGFGTILGANPTTKTDTAWHSLVTASNVFYFFLDSSTFQQGQQATVNGNAMAGVSVWANLRFAHAPKDTAHRAVPLTGTFSATKP